MATVEAVLLLLCLLYCLFAPNRYEAKARVELRMAPNSMLGFQGPENYASASILSAPLALETLAGVLRSDQLAWRTITDLKLYEQPGFRGRFAKKFPGFDPSRPSPAAEDWLLKRFATSLHVQAAPHTLLVEVRFRSKDPALSAAVVNTLLRDDLQQQTDARIQATAAASAWLDGQLSALRARVDSDQQRLADFERKHGLVTTPTMQADGVEGETEHDAALIEIDELSRQLVAATTDRILSEAEYRAASQGDPELVIAADPRLQAANADFSTALLQQIRARQSDLEQQKAQLRSAFGPNFPQVVEIDRQLQDLDRQKKAEDAKLVERFQRNWQTATDRERLVRESLGQATSEGMKVNQAATEYAVMRQEADASHQLYLRALEQSEEAGLAAGVQGSNFSIVDLARQPAKPVSPNPLVDFAITFFAGLWIAAGAAFLRDALKTAAPGAAALLLVLLAAGGALHAQAPTPNTAGLPSGVVGPLDAQTPQQSQPIPPRQSAPIIWNSQGTTGPNANHAQEQTSSTQFAAPMSAPIGPGDLLNISEYHIPGFQASVRVAPDGTVVLPLIGEVSLNGLDERSAARVIEAVFVKQGMVLHPQVSVLVTYYAGQDVSVLGEVNRPGVYPYTYHHRLLDLISAAQGLSANAGRLVNIFHANDPKTPHPVALDPSGQDTSANHNPELLPGDTVQVSRAGLVYVVGDVIRPGGFPVDPVQGLTIVQALSLAWGASQNANLKHAVLIREQKGGRTMLALNLKSMLSGKDPDVPVHDRDILYVPNSMAKDIWYKTLESAIQSAIGVSIYAGLVYSQWHVPTTNTTSVSKTTGSSSSTTGANSGTSTGSSTSTTTTTTSEGP